jgi:hypothetical protein
VGGGLPFFILEIIMPCEIQIKTDHHARAVNYEHPDIEKDRRGVYKKGYPVSIFDEPKVHRGFKEGLPCFCYVRVTDATAAEVDAMIVSTFSGTSLLQQWDREIDFATVNNDPVIDGWRIRTFATNPGATGLANITQAMVENYLTRWNAEVFSSAANEVVYDVAVFEDSLSNPGALQSEGFWEVSPNGIVFTETAYNSGTGDHTVEADYSATSFEPTKVEGRVVERGGTVDSHAAQVITFTINRTDVFQWFQQEVKEAVENTIYRRQFRIPEATVDTIISTGTQVLIDHYDEDSNFRGQVEYRVLDRTLAQVEAFLINRLDEIL